MSDSFITLDTTVVIASHYDHVMMLGVPCPGGILTTLSCVKEGVAGIVRFLRIVRRSTT